MSDDDGKILQLEKELERLTSEISKYKEQLKELKAKGTSKPESIIPQSEEHIATPSTLWEYPVHKRENEEGLEKFIGLRMLHISGILAFVIGISIGVKYAIDKDLITPAMRILLAYAAGSGLFFLSVRLKKKYELFSAFLLSGAMASIYFTSFAAYAYYQLFSGILTFLLMLAITGFTIYSAIRYNRELIALLGMVGAYAIPFLISVNTGRADLFFSYIILINIGISVLAFKKEWNAMSGTALFISWILYYGWAFLSYDNEDRSLGLGVMTIYYFLFSITTLGFSILRKTEISFESLVLFLLNSIFTFGAFLWTYSDIHSGVDASTITGIAGLIFLVEALLFRWKIPSAKLLFNSLMAFSVLCLIFYIEMKWTGMPVTMGWLLVAAGLFTMGLLSRINWFRLAAVLITIGALGKLVLFDRKLLTPEQKIISYIAIGVWMLLLSYFYQRNKRQLMKTD